MIGNWRQTLSNYWTNTQVATEKTLQSVKDDFECSGMVFDDKFKEYFLRTTNARVVQVYEGFILEVQFNPEPTNKKTTTDASGETEINQSHNCQQTDSILPTISQEVNALGDRPRNLPFLTPFYDETNGSEERVPNNKTFQVHSTFVDENIDPKNATESIEAMIGNQPISTVQLNESQATILSENGLNGNEIDRDNPIETSNKILTMAYQNSVHPTDPIVQGVDPETNGVTHCLEMNNCINEHQAMSALTPIHELSAIQFPGDETLQRFVSFVSNNIDENNDTASVREMLGSESFFAQVNVIQANALNENSLNGNEIGSDNPIQASNKEIAIDSQAQSISMQPTVDLIASSVAPELNDGANLPGVNEHQSMPVITTFHELSQAHILVTAPLGVILGNDMMSVEFDEPQVTLTDKIGISEDDIRNSTAVNGVTKTNVQPDSAISESDDIIVTNASELEVIHVDRPNNLPVVDLIIENAEVPPEKASNQANRKDVKQVKANQRKRKIASETTSNDNSKKKRKIEPLSESTLIDVASMGETKSSKQSKKVQRNETKSVGVQLNGSTSNGKSKTKCEFCNYVTTRPSHLIIHRRIHTGEKPFECKICVKGFTRKDALKTHMRTHANQFPFHCSICRQGFAVKWEKETHEKNCDQRRFECYVCKYATLYKTHLVTHMRIHTGELPFKCKICAKGFAQKGVHTRHMRTHANQFPFHCSICRQGFAVKWENETHEKNCNQRRFECYLCKYATLNKGHLVTHMRLHTGDKPFRCSHCPKRFVTKSHLKWHQKRHQIKTK
ncbi:uncharacterized protein LOC116347810 [Contarinia nasturtii]|uniref:uncharacterized protein LOC116347810 n=1 Tax=Contarinia nasturtii TaxID=265458 RepID=UPI0012D38BE1|nr:uncharacterized protein LOC116347810 [Contarinia nasturtii]